VATDIGLERLQELLAAGAQLVEVLPAEEYTKAHLPDAINLPLATLDERGVALLDRGRPVVVYCWDALWDLSARAACRLEILGFSEVYDYVFGKVDWLAHRLPVEGERAEAPTAGRVARDDVVRCHPRDRAGDVLALVERSIYPFGLVTADHGMLLGRVRTSDLRSAPPDADVSQIMELAPATNRPHRAARDIAKRLADRDLRWTIITTPEGRLLGVASREDLERLAADEGG
jgi:rhodanese-related sulfurtransferase